MSEGRHKSCKFERLHRDLPIFVLKTEADCLLYAVGTVAPLSAGDVELVRRYWASSNELPERLVDFVRNVEHSAEQAQRQWTAQASIPFQPHESDCPSGQRLQSDLRLLLLGASRFYRTPTERGANSIVAGSLRCSGIGCQELLRTRPAVAGGNSWRRRANGFRRADGSLRSRGETNRCIPQRPL